MHLQTPTLNQHDKHDQEFLAQTIAFVVQHDAVLRISEPPMHNDLQPQLMLYGFANSV